MSTPGITAVTMSLTTAWVKLAGLQGFQRAYRAKVLGKYLGQSSVTAVGTIALEVGYDFDETFATAVQFSVVPTTTTMPIQFEHHLLKQKCEAVRFRLTWTSEVGAIRLTGISVLMGVKGQFFKIASGKRV